MPTGRGVKGAVAAIGGQAQLERMQAEHDLDYLGAAIRDCLGAGGIVPSEVAAARVAWHVRREVADWLSDRAGEVDSEVGSWVSVGDVLRQAADALRDAKGTP